MAQRGRVLQRPKGQPLLMQLLTRKGTLDLKKVEAVRAAQTRGGDALEEVLVRTGAATDHDIARAYADYFYLPLLEPDSGEIDQDADLKALLPEKLCRDRVLAPTALRDGVLYVAFAIPSELLMVDEIQLITGLEVCPQIAAISTVEGILARLHYGSGWAGAELASGKIFETADPADDESRDEEPGEEVLHLDQPPPPGRDGRIIRMVNHILEQAFNAGASDIHLEPFNDSCKVRLRIDGSLNELPPPPPSLFVPIVSRIKVLARMDIAEKRLPQDGAIALKNGEKRIDLRVNTVPTIYGEKVVMRVLDKSAIPLELSGLGLEEGQAADLTEAIEMPHGLILVTGPTGSGKSTTLYACLNLLNRSDRNICTVEDPVEYKFKGMNQIQVKSQVGLTFASALRAFLRQDPDIIMVGEVRDQETADICVRAALTGHLVLSSLHTNDALSAVDRLLDMGVEPFLLASTLRALQAQRLLRRLCAHCKQPYDCDQQTAERYRLPAGHTLYRPEGCDHCRGTGYRGRVGIFEVVRINHQLASLIQRHAPLEEMRAAAREMGVRLLPDSALSKVLDGLTSLEQAVTVLVSES